MATKIKQTKSTLPAVVAQQAAMVPAMTNTIRQVTKAKVGQPTKRSKKVVDEILNRIADGESLLAICQDAHLPGYSTFNRWCREDPVLDEQVLEAYRWHARTIDDMIDDMLAGGPTSCGDFKRDTERAAHLRWRLGKLNRRFGDKQQIDVVTYEPVVLGEMILRGPGGDGV